jgi:peptide deformylase
MIIKEAIQVGNPIIRVKSTPVANPKLKVFQRVITDLIDSMHHHGLVGMAAPQIGKSVRIFVTEINETKLRKGMSLNEIDALRVFINPKITSSSRIQKKGWEGCGSVASANLFGMVKRPASLEIEAFDENGKPFYLKAKGLLARVIQHEMDHLNGVIFADKADTKTYMSKNEYLKLRSKTGKKVPT